MEAKPVLVKNFQEKKQKKFNLKPTGLVLLIVLAGVVTGYLLSTKSGLISKKGQITSIKEGEEISQGTTVGIDDEKTFKDEAEGKLEKGGVGGEGSHHLVRPGGESQNVYLTSSTIDLDKFVGREVKVWGETFTAQKAGWLMDVGKLEVLE